MTFWERFYNLCLQHNTKPLPVAKALFISVGSITKWKNGTIPTGETITKIADYFQVSADYLLGRTDDPNQQPGQESIKFDEFTYAMYEESKELTEDDKQMLLDFARRLKAHIAEEKRSSDGGHKHELLAETV